MFTIVCSNSGFAGPHRNSHAQLKERWGVDEPFLDQLGREPQLPGIEDLQLRLDTELLHALRANAQHVRCGHVQLLSLTEFE
jgi:hypothetical protein